MNETPNETAGTEPAGTEQKDPQGEEPQQKDNLLRRLRQATLARPSIKPGGRMITVTLMLTGLALVLAALPLPPAPTPATVEGGNGPVPVFTDDADEYITDDQIQLKLVDYLAVNAWAEFTFKAAENDPMNFTKAMLARPSTTCAADYREAQLRDHIEPDNALSAQSILDCVEREINLNPGSRPPWDEMTQIEREAHSRARLRMLWRAISPELHISTKAALQQAVEMNRENNEAFRRFVEEYQECENHAEQEAVRLSQTEDGKPLGDAWMQVNMELRKCASTNTERLFPQNLGTRP